jgi:uncharacterized repeat protein (TIGR03803 family)
VHRLNWWRTASAICALCASAAIALPAQTLATIHSFGYPGGGLEPFAPLVQGIDGYFYGAAYYGGANDGCQNGCGMLFKIGREGRPTTLYNFCSQSNCADGDQPDHGLIQGIDGNLYGTTPYGGENGDYGTVFKITLGGELTTLYSFCSESNCADGAEPEGALVQAIDGSFYSTTLSGGANIAGTIFKITPSGTLTTLYSFCSQSGCTDGSGPHAGLVQASNGYLYGTTLAGGAHNWGTVFRITPSGTMTRLYNFCSLSNCADGAAPYAGLVQGSDGNLYGTTEQGGRDGNGTVFKITPNGALKTLRSFDITNGSYPIGGLVQGTDGSLYGAAEGGGAYDEGTLFKVTPSGNLTTLYSFCSQGGSRCTDGDNPYDQPIQGTDGNFYGTTQGGGVYGYGTVFSLTVGLGPFVETQPTSGKVGTVLKILGTNLAGATSVTFNGTPATFRVVSASLITATVPAGATTGTLQVVTPGGTLSSNVPFRVIP